MDRSELAMFASEPVNVREESLQNAAYVYDLSLIHI